MKKQITVEGHSCDVCGAEVSAGYVSTCMHCGAEHCWDCSKTEGKAYQHGVYLGGSGDGYYCNGCDVSLTKNGSDPRHREYRAIESLRREAEEWEMIFRRRKKAAEEKLEALSLGGQKS